MVKWFEEKPKLTSPKLQPPGIWEALFKRTLGMGPLDLAFSVGAVGCIITAIVMELMYLVPGFSGLFAGGGWVVMWIHGAFGIVLVIGGLGYVKKYCTNKCFRLAYGKMFFVDGVFVAVISLTGLILGLKILGVMPATFGPYAMLKVSLVYVWLIVSLFAGGAARHVLGTIAWRIHRDSGLGAAVYFSDACARCGKCIEVCPAFDAFGGEERDAPALKLRKSLKTLITKELPPDELKAIVEETCVCSSCGLCVGVCPYSFDFIDLYSDLLAHVNKLHGETTAKA